MKSYTDIKQSKKLADILSFESADGFYEAQYNSLTDKWEYILFTGNKWASEEVVIPCWSLSALLDVLESEIDGEEGETYRLNIEKDGIWWNVWYREQYDRSNFIETKSTKELIDACYEMILKLHKPNKNYSGYGLQRKS